LRSTVHTQLKLKAKANRQGDPVSPFDVSYGGIIMSTDTEILIDEKIKHTVKEPSKYKVLALNDDVTPIDWVIDLLISVFKHSEGSAKEITMKIHSEGSAVVGIYTYEIAEQKTAEAISASRDRGFPLQFTLEAE